MGHKVDEDLKVEIREDLYNTIEGVTGNKALARAVLSRSFEDLCFEHGDSKELYAAIYKKAGLHMVNGELVEI